MAAASSVKPFPTASGRKRLSNNILQMKFMKKTKQKHEKELEDEERQRMFKNDISKGMRSKESRFLLDPSYVNIEDLEFGRWSFHGMNPDVEKIMAENLSRRLEAEEVKKETDVGDADMAASQFSVLHNTVARKFSTKKGQKKKQTVRKKDRLRFGASNKKYFE